jgi:hypothetical protein
MAHASLDYVRPALQKLYREDATVRVLFEALGQRSRCGPETEADMLTEIAKVEYGDLIAALRLLDKIGVGSFIVGRRSRKTRFEWSIPAIEAAKAAMDSHVQTSAEINSTLSATTVPVEEARKFRPAENAKAEPVAASDHQVAPESIAHTYALRPGLTVQVSLPADLTRKEADRLSQWITSLPFGDD